MNKLLFIPALAMLAACNLTTVKGSGNVVSQTFNESGFSSIDAESNLKVILKQGADYSVRIEAEDNILKLLRVVKEGDKLKIDYKNHINVSTSKDVKVYITAPNYRNLDGSGACSFESEGLINGGELSIDLSGASNARLNLSVQKLEIDASGASEVALMGKTTAFEIDGSGSTSVKAFNFLSEHTKVGLSGAGSAEVYASKSLDVHISGAGSVDYKGHPAKVSQDLSGAGAVKSVE